MGIQISRLSPLIQTQMPVLPTAQAVPEQKDQPVRVVAAAGSTGAELQGGMAQRDAARDMRGAARFHRPTTAGAAAGTGAAPTVGVGKNSPFQDRAAIGAGAQPDFGAMPLAQPSPAADGSEAARHYAETAEALEEAQSFMDRVSLVPEPGDLALAASEMPPYGQREGDRTAFAVAPTGETLTRS